MFFLKKKLSVEVANIYSVQINLQYKKLMLLTVIEKPMQIYTGIQDQVRKN